MLDEGFVFYRGFLRRAKDRERTELIRKLTQLPQAK
jgi:hypothetical protein